VRKSSIGKLLDPDVILIDLSTKAQRPLGLERSS